VLFELSSQTCLQDSSSGSLGPSVLCIANSADAITTHRRIALNCLASCRPAGVLWLTTVLCLPLPGLCCVVLPCVALQYMHMAEADILEQQTSETAQRTWGRGVIHPLDRRYRIWW
jgi:hypothetical protein